MSFVVAPWTDEQVENLRLWQTGAAVHPYTCPNSDTLVPTNAGWECHCCDYTQDWAHDFSCEGVPEFLDRVKVYFSEDPSSG